MIVLQITTSHPIPKNDIIAGKEFLSIFINQDSQKKPDERRESRYFKKDDVLPIESMFQDEELQLESSNYYGFRRKQKEIPNYRKQTTTIQPEISSSVINDNTVKLVETGSQIIFLETTTKEFKKLTKENPTNINSTNDEDLPKTENIQITKVSVSSSVHQSVPVKQKTTLIPKHLDEQSDNVFISNSHKTDFSIEEIDPLTVNENEKQDSENSESSNIPTIVDAPSHPSFQPRSRTQRKQDGVVPYQSVVYHDYNSKESNTQPRSVSYTSISQTIGEVNSRTEYRSDLPNKTDYPRIYGEAAKIYSEPEKVYGIPSRIYSEPSKYYSQPSQIYSVPAKVYSEPSKIYGEPEKVYSVPSKIYSEPAKVYSEPSKIYSEPSKTYGEPSKVYSIPAKVYFHPTSAPNRTQPQQSRRIVFNLDKLPYDLLNAPIDEKIPQPSIQYSGRSLFTPNFDTKNDVIQNNDDKNSIFNYDYEKQNLVTTTTSTTTEFTPTPEQNYEIDEAVSVMTNGRQHGVQPIIPTPNPADDSQKTGYVVEGRNYRKYRVEEKTPDGFIVGEYGVVSHNDGSLRGVRYTADSNISPRLIHETLLKFLSL